MGPRLTNTVGPPGAYCPTLPGGPFLHPTQPQTMPRKTKINHRPNPATVIDPSRAVSTGSSLLNLALTDDPYRGFPQGAYIFIVGDSSSGKTFTAMTCLAEANQAPDLFGSHRFIFDDVEGGALMDLAQYFGQGVADRMEPPTDAGSSTTIESFYDNLNAALADGRPFIYILDSMDALDSMYAAKKDNEAASARAGGKTAKGDFGDGKAKVNSRNLRRCVESLKRTGSILIIINQTRDNPNAGLFESSKTRSGGHALKFYATAEVWTSIRSRITKDVNGTKRQIGIVARYSVKKNRVTGKDWSVDVPVYWSYGIDDLGGCVAYLVAEGRWSKNKQGRITASDFADITGTREQVVQQIEEADLVPDVLDIVATVHRDVVARCALPRKRRYV